VEKLLGKRSLEITRRRQQSNIQMNLSETVCEGGSWMEAIDYNSQNVRARLFNFVHSFKEHNLCSLKIAPFNSDLPAVTVSLAQSEVQRHKQHFCS